MFFWKRPLVYFFIFKDLYRKIKIFLGIDEHKIADGVQTLGIRKNGFKCFFKKQIGFGFVVGGVGEFVVNQNAVRMQTALQIFEKQNIAKLRRHERINKNIDANEVKFSFVRGHKIRRVALKNRHVAQQIGAHVFFKKLDNLPVNFYARAIYVFFIRFLDRKSVV